MLGEAKISDARHTAARWMPITFNCLRDLIGPHGLASECVAIIGKDLRT
jgi:hypothetical protein